MATRHARTTWEMDLEGGRGRIDMTSSGLGPYPLTFHRRTGRDPQGTTGPEELLAAAHSSDYAMHLSAVVAVAGG
ncbi:peroxiredoxin, partial [Escherichia coli]